MNQELISLFRTLTHGVYVIGVSDGNRINAFTAAWVMQVSFDPLLLALSIHPDHTSYAVLKQPGAAFSVNVLPDDRQDLAKRFGRGGDGDKLKGIAWHPGKTGAPCLEEAMAYFDCEVSHECAAGDHVLVIGRVVGGALTRPGCMPMTYRDTGDMDGSSGLFPDDFV